MSFANFFSRIQESPWYGDFLNPVIKEVDFDTNLLDIGTGSGKMIQILSKEKNVNCIGIDTNRKMLNEAKIKLKDTNAKLVEIEPNVVLPFDNAQFDVITICSVLFHLDNDGIDFVLDESRRLLKTGGKIIVHTPTGDGNIFKLSQKYFSIKNRSIYTWYLATRNKAKKWSNNKYLKAYTAKNNWQYHSKLIMNDFAQIEIINK